MSEVDEVVIAPIEGLLASIPMGGSPVGRVLIGAALGGAFAYGVKPAMSFDAKGKARNWILTHSDDPNAALFPAWAWVVMPAVILGVFI